MNERQAAERLGVFGQRGSENRALTVELRRAKGRREGRGRGRRRGGEGRRGGRRGRERREEREGERRGERRGEEERGDRWTRSKR